MVDNGNILKLTEPFFFQENSFLLEFGQKEPKIAKNNFFLELI